MRNCFTITLLFIGLQQTYAQYLTGTRMPDFVLQDLQNYNGTARSIADFKGKVVVIDFWSRYCTSCIGAFSKMDSIARKFQGRVQFLYASCLNGKQDYQLSAEIFKRQQERYQLQIPIVYDSIMWRALDIHGVPHILIIDAEGEIVASIGDELFNESVLNDVLADKPIYLSEKVPGRVKDKQNRLQDSLGLTGVIKNLADVRYLSIFTEEQPELGRRMGNKKIDGNRSAVVQYNWGGLTLYSRAYSKGVLDRGSFPQNQVVLEVRHPEKLIEKKYCLEIILPEEREKDKNMRYQEQIQLIRKCLDEGLSVSSQLEIHMRDCYALIPLKDTILLSSRGEAPASEFKDGGTHGMSLVNRPISDLIRLITSRTTKPVLDETGIKGNVDIDVDLDLRLPVDERFRVALRKAGLDLVEVRREVEVLVIRDR